MTNSLTVALPACNHTRLMLFVDVCHRAAVLAGHTISALLEDARVAGVMHVIRTCTRLLVYAVTHKTYNTGNMTDKCCTGADGI